MYEFHYCRPLCDPADNVSCSTACHLQIPHGRTFVFLVSMALHFSRPPFLVSRRVLSTVPNLFHRCGILCGRLFSRFHSLFQSPPLTVGICKSCVRLSHRRSNVSIHGDPFYFSCFERVAGNDHSKFKVSIKKCERISMLSFKWELWWYKYVKF